ncbi:MAG TPA: hypothetical protein PLS71_07920 [Leptospiraceae bacterium]|nr:hypothetical protein [Leptospiraceae bacterium]
MFFFTRFQMNSAINLYKSKLVFIAILFLLLSQCKLNDSPKFKGYLPSIVSTRYTIGGTVTQLGSGKTIVLQNNSGNDLTISTNGAYTFSASIANNASYEVTILTQPTNQTCVLSNASGSVTSANIVNVDVTCSIGVLSSGTIINPLNLTGGVTTLNGSPCGASASGCSSVSGYADSTSPDSVKYNGAEGITTDGTNAKVDGTGTSASLSLPRFLTTDGTYLYVSDTTNNCIRKVNITSAVVTTIVCNNTLLSDPRGLIVYNNMLYIADNSANAIRQIDLSTNALSTVISSGLSSPRNMTLIGSDIYIADSGLDRVAKTTIGTWTLSTFAGSSSGYLDGTGTGAQFKNLEGITTDGTDLYVADTGNHNVRKVTVPGAVVTTLAGSLSASSGYTNSSTFSTARFNNPRGITSDGTNLYVFDSNNNAIRKIQ